MDVVNFKSEGASNKIQLVMDKCELSHNTPFLTLLFVNYDGSLVITISHRENLRLGLFEWSSRGDTAVFDRRIVNTSVGAPLTDTAGLDALQVVCNKVKTIQGSRICLVVFIP